MSSVPEAPWCDLPHPPHLGFTLAGSPSLSPARILMAAQLQIPLLSHASQHGGDLPPAFPT